jgi:hypothetical protein
MAELIQTSKEYNDMSVKQAVVLLVSGYGW